MSSSSTRPSSPVPRERPPFIARGETVSLIYPNGWTSSAYQPLHNGREDTLKDKSPHLDVTLDSNCVFLKGTGVNVEPAFLTGHVVLTLTEPTSLKEITLQFRGKARLPVPATESFMNNAGVVSYVVCDHDWSFLKGDKKHSHTLKAGHHTFPFQLRVDGSLPSSISTHDDSAGVTYRLRAQATRPGFSSNLHVNVPVHIIRSFGSDALEYQQTLEIENTWPEKIMYSIMLPHKAWASGDTVTALAKISPLNKGISVLSIGMTLYESTSVYARSGSQDHTRPLVAVKHSIINGKAVSPDCDSSAASSSSSNSNRSRYSNQADGGQDDPVRENNDVVTSVTIPIPSYAVPSHGLEPILVTHRIRWIIRMSNPDGHTSELRCSLPIHILDGRLLQEVTRRTAVSRRLLIGGPELPSEEEEMELPSYPSHVRDLIADLGPLGASNPSASISPTPPLTPDNGLPIQALFSVLPSGYSTPIESNPFSYLPHVPDSGDNMPLEWINSELLSRQPYRSRRRPVFQMLDEHTDSDHSRPTSQPASTYPSRPTSRSASPDPINNGSSNTYQHQHRNDPHNQSHRNLHGFLKATMKPFTSITHSNWLLKTGSHGNVNDLPDQHAVQHGRGRHSHQPSQSSHSPHSPETIPASCPPPRPPLPRRISQPSQVSHLHPRLGGTAPMSSSSFTTEPTLGLFLPRALTEVPNYDAASRTGFMACVPPLTSLQGLPSYEEAAMSSSSSSSPSADVPSSLNVDTVGVNSRWSEDPADPPRPGFAFGPGQRTRSEPNLVTRMAGLGWGLSTRQS